MHEKDKQRMKPIHFPKIFQGQEVAAAESTRLGGVSPAPYESLNLGWHTDDAADNVRENRRRFLAALPASPEAVAESFQVHGKEVLHARQPGKAHGYDALISQEMGLVVGVSVADCCPILIYDARQRAIAAVHAGWRGTAAQIVTQTMEQMQRTFGTQPLDCLAYVGTCISQANYEVDGQVASQFEKAYKKPGAAAGKWMLDLKAANRGQLLAAGVPAEQIEVSPFCTWDDNGRYFSHRREQGAAGRFMAVIALK